MMAGRMKSWRTLRLLVLISLLSLTELFEVRGDGSEELSPDIAANVSEKLTNPWNQRLENPMSLLDDLQDCENITACVIQRKQDFDNFLAAIDEQKTQDFLLSASEISHSYSQKLLVMTDEEKSTNDRVQQEYSMDPHYSLIVSQECLNNVSCVPEADSYTVVKIFGRVSEDGRTMSGLSGSSLAELMLKPSLKSVPVFSLDGNTTRDFQHNFNRVFMVRDIPTVLETKQENQQIYQLMNQHGSVSEYRIPQRPVDHSTQYDHQQILIMEDDPFVIKAATYLYEKHPTVTSVYALDKSQKPKLIHGASEPLTEDSRLVLVGHGRRDTSGEMKLAGYRAKDVSKIIQQTFRVSDQIKTTSVVACEVGSDKVFAETLLNELHETAGITTELHLRNAVLQVKHTGEKITQEISKDGIRWRHKDDSNKVVATLDKNGQVVIRNGRSSKGQATFTTERNFLGKKNERFRVYRDSWPKEPRSFIDQNVFDSLEHADRNAYNELEALSWGFFHADLPLPEKINFNLEEFYLAKMRDNNEIERIVNNNEKDKILSNCYEIKSGKDVRNVIRHYAKTGENKPTYLMVNDWILEVDPVNLYVHPVGKKLDNNQIENQQKIDEVEECIREQIGKERYPDMRKEILKNMNEPMENYANYVKGIFNREHTFHLPLSTEAWFTTYFTASVISESARNFRTFPLVLMALDMIESSDNNIRQKGLDFLWEDHSMASGRTWIDPSRRGFSGSATPEGSSKLQNYNPSTKGELMVDLKKVLTKEVKLYKSWVQNGKDIKSEISNFAEKYKITEITSVQETIVKGYDTFKTKLKDSSPPPASGSLGGNDDGHVTSRDLKSAAELENFSADESFRQTCDKIDTCGSKGIILKVVSESSPSQSNDILGNDHGDALIDALEGGEGDDTLIGSNGADILIGYLGDDTLYGEDGNDIMLGNSGQDVFIPGPGADLMDGGPGRDTVLYRGDHDTGKGVYVNLLTGQGRYADAEGDVLMDVETVIGTIYSDVLVSGYESSLLRGSDGNDILVSTGGDYLVGGDGNDIYVLAFDHGSVTIDNSAKDKATDVLYLSSQSTQTFDCQLLSDRVVLTFFGQLDQTVEIILEGWTSDDNECGHLKLFYRDVEVSVDELLQEFQLRQNKAVWSLDISWVIYICLPFGLFFTVRALTASRRKGPIKKNRINVRARSPTTSDRKDHIESNRIVRARATTSGREDHIESKRIVRARATTSGREDHIESNRINVRARATTTTNNMTQPPATSGREDPIESYRINVRARPTATSGSEDPIDIGRIIGRARGTTTSGREDRFESNRINVRARSPTTSGREPTMPGSEDPIDIGRIIRRALEQTTLGSVDPVNIGSIIRRALEQTTSGREGQFERNVKIPCPVCGRFH